MGILKLGIDVGNGYTKFKGLKFASKVSLGEQPKVGEKQKETHYVKFEDEDYIIGEGNNFLGMERYFTKEYTLCLLTSIALSSDDTHISAKIVVGLPYTRVETVAGNLKKHLLTIKNARIRVDNKNFTINIDDVKIFVEGAYPILVQDKSNCITIDKGAGTICVNHFDNLHLEKSMIYENSELNLFGDIAQAINSTHCTSFNADTVEPIVYKEYALIKRKKTRIADVTEKIIDQHIKGISNDIIKDFNLDGILLENIYLIGGTAEDTKPYFEKYLGDIDVINDNQFINQQLYQAVADAM